MQLPSKSLVCTLQLFVLSPCDFEASPTEPSCAMSPAEIEIVIKRLCGLGAPKDASRVLYMLR